MKNIIYALIGISLAIVGIAILNRLIIINIQNNNKIEEVDYYDFDCSTVVLGGKNNDEYMATTMQKYYCDYIGEDKLFKVDKDRFDYYASVGYDTTQSDSGHLYIADFETGEKVATAPFGKLTVLEVMQDEVLNNRYYFVLVGVFDTTYCTKLIGDPLYDYCGEMYQDLSDFGGIWMFDSETKELIHLWAYSV